MKSLIKTLSLCASLLLSACSTITGIGTDNAPEPTPLTSIKSPAFKPELVFTQETGVGADDLYYKFRLAVNCQSLYVVDAKGHASALNLNTGKPSWAVATKARASSGVAASEDLVVFATKTGKVYALSAQDGQTRWTSTIPNQVLATPLIARDAVYVKTIDGELIALDAGCGKVLWRYEHVTPTYILRESSAVQVQGDRLLVGFSDGKLACYQAESGQLLWEESIATPTGRGLMRQLVDISADPSIQAQRVYVATYQGNLAAVSLQTGEILWSQPISDYAGLVVTPEAVVVSESDGAVSAYAKTDGRLLWKQTALLYRGVTGPAWQGETVVVADKQGYVHWIALSSGCLVARAKTVHEPILTTPLVRGPFVYLLNQKGKVFVFRVK